ncbi:hypothetical protein N824_18800 [Pedobacter sp. V48]|nr:hypothetical protein N824_18800 [Pedobacter sp. V48]
MYDLYFQFKITGFFPFSSKPNLLEVKIRTRLGLPGESKMRIELQNRGLKDRIDSKHQ